MKKNLFKKAFAVVMTITVAGVIMTGCGKSEENAQPAADAQVEETKTEETKAEEAPAAEDTSDETAKVPGAPYFTKGCVYANYSGELENPDKTYFYIISGDDYGYTADGEHDGIGVPFKFSQEDGKVTFSFGGEDEESMETLVITAVDNGSVHGYFDDIPDRSLIFEPLEGVEADTFDAVNYINGPENSVYHDANGWSIKYDATRFELTPQGPNTFIVYTGESAGTNMITVTYTVDNKAEAAIKEMGAGWGDKTTYSEGPFPGASYAKGYWAMLPPEEDGSGMYETAVARDYMDGALIFELTGHNGEDEEQNMAVSDAMAGIIDSLTFDIYSYDTILQYLGDDAYYAYADMDELNDALLVTTSDYVFDDGDIKAATEASVFGYDKNGMIVEYGYVAGGGTATPLACKDSILFYGGHNYMNKVHIDENAGEMITDEGEYFDEYDDAVTVNFNPASKQNK